MKVDPKTYYDDGNAPTWVWVTIIVLVWGGLFLATKLVAPYEPKNPSNLGYLDPEITPEIEGNR